MKYTKCTQFICKLHALKKKKLSLNNALMMVFMIQNEKNISNILYLGAFKID